MTARLSPLPYDKKACRQTRSIRFSPSEIKQIKKKARLFAGGDFSEWVRQAAVRYVPDLTGQLDLENKGRS